MPHPRRLPWLAALGLILTGCQTNSPAGSPTVVEDATPPRLLTGLGPVHMSVTTADPQAQKFFDQGLALIYAFNHAEAARAFRHAATLDPRLAMAHWGLAYALGPNINAPEIDADAAKAARAAAQRAVELSVHASQAERDYINAIARRYPADPKADLRKHAEEFAGAMKAVSRKHPTDVHAATLYAESMMNLRPWQLYTPDGKPQPGTEEIVQTLEWVLARDPNHTGANHYYIHATEASLNPGVAMAAAKRLPKLAPNAGHLVHMPAHVYIRTGDYASAIAANEAASKVDEMYISCCGPSPKGAGAFYAALYYSHNLHFLSVCAAMAGRSKEATAAANKLTANVDPAIDAMPPVEGFAIFPALVAVRQGQWYEILKAPAPKANRHLTRAFHNFARAMAHLATRNTAAALTERDAFEAAAAKADPKLPVGNNTAGQMIQIARHVLAGKLAAARNDTAAAKAEYEKAIALQDVMNYEEPPSWPWPVRETLGAHLLKTGDPAAAEAVFREDLKRTLNNPRSMLGLSESLKARGKHVDAETERKKFDAAWRDADMKLNVADY
ncbi:MAG TPA: hypothetical protein VEA69_06690 [Tepidisphaeraceae bacterium]|nr:hypothetical protein [Tepidisphaeraceae bacterium]